MTERSNSNIRSSLFGGIKKYDFIVIECATNKHGFIIFGYNLYIQGTDLDDC